MTLPKIIAHRGASFYAPENTLASVRLGWAQDADAVETDIHLTRDGEVVALHDHTLKRTAGHEGRVAEMTLAEVRALDAGVWKDAVYAGERVPFLSELLATTPAGKEWYVELKVGPEIVPPLVRVLAESSVPLESVTLISFYPETLRAAKAALPRCAAYRLASGHEAGRQRTTEDLDKFIAEAREAGFDGLDLGNDWPIDAAFVRRVRDAGLSFHVWTINSPERACELAALGVDSLTTDRPDLIRSALGRMVEK